MTKIDKIVCAFFVAVAVFYAGGKGGSVRFPRTDPEVWYLMDTGSVVSNDSVHVRFARNLIVPGSANVFMDGMDVAYTNDSDWAVYSFPAYSNRFDALTIDGFDFPFQAATNFNWIVYTDYVPGPIVHTNGVAFVVWQTANSTNRLVTYRTGIYAGAARLAPNPAITNSPPMPAVMLSIPTEANQ